VNRDILEGMWKQIRGSLKETWGEITDQEFEEIDGKRDKLAGKLQEKYGWSRAEAEVEIDKFLNDTERSLKSSL
jgi:uncharacterized protein YjbJ (UPF0337 family)